MMEKRTMCPFIKNVATEKNDDKHQERIWKEASACFSETLEGATPFCVSQLPDDTEKNSGMSNPCPENSVDQKGLPCTQHTFFFSNKQSGYEHAYTQNGEKPEKAFNFFRDSKKRIFCYIFHLLDPLPNVSLII